MASTTALKFSFKRPEHENIKNATDDNERNGMIALQVTDRLYHAAARALVLVLVFICTSCGQSSGTSSATMHADTGDASAASFEPHDVRAEFPDTKGSDAGDAAVDSDQGDASDSEVLSTDADLPEYSCSDRQIDYSTFEASPYEPVEDCQQEVYQVYDALEEGELVYPRIPQIGIEREDDRYRTLVTETAGHQATFRVVNGEYNREYTLKTNEFALDEVMAPGEAVDIFNDNTSVGSFTVLRGEDWTLLISRMSRSYHREPAVWPVDGREWTWNQRCIGDEEPVTSLNLVVAPGTPLQRSLSPGAELSYDGLTVRYTLGVTRPPREEDGRVVEGNFRMFVEALYEHRVCEIDIMRD